MKTMRKDWPRIRQYVKAGIPLERLSIASSHRPRATGIRVAGQASTNMDAFTGVSTDSQGNIYVGGATGSLAFHAAAPR
jgi:hypothetical protein